MFGSKKNKYCCGWFSVFHQQPKTAYCIRIVKFYNTEENLGHLETHYAVGESGKRRFVWHSDIPYRFFYSEPKMPQYLKFDLLSAGLMLSYCPWCGVNLFTFYARERNIDDYVNEIEGETF